MDFRETIELSYCISCIGPVLNGDVDSGGPGGGGGMGITYGHRD